MILGGDIGGTKVNLGVFELHENRLKISVEASFPSQKYARLQDIVKEFLSANGNPPIKRACFGIAGPVRNGAAKLTNLPWLVVASEVAEEFKFTSVSLINDLEANGYGLAELTPEDFYVLNAGSAEAAGNAAIISAGTGLGEAGMYWDGVKHRVFACEGGHSDFAPQTKLDSELFDYLHDRFGHVSWERVLSGTGLINIYQFLRDTGLGEEPASLAEAMIKTDPAIVITKAGLDGSSSRCSQALDMFVTYYGAEAGNLGLKIMATGGIYVGGGIAPKILSRLQDGKFITALQAKGKMKSLLEGTPVRVVLNPKTALLGAAHYAAHGAQSIANPAQRSA